MIVKHKEAIKGWIKIGSILGSKGRIVLKAREEKGHWVGQAGQEDICSDTSMSLGDLVRTCRAWYDYAGSPWDYKEVKNLPFLE